jgi:hypothetical protein
MVWVFMVWPKERPRWQPPQEQIADEADEAEHDQHGEHRVESTKALRPHDAIGET